MTSALQLQASVACANLAQLGSDLQQLEAAGVDCLHVDFMDGRFVSNFGLDFSMMHAIRKVTSLPMDCHLMVEDPERYVDRVVAAGATYVSIHVEATRHLQRTLQQIREAGAKAGLAMNPATPICSLDYVLDDMDMVTVMTVNPGYAGQKLVAATVKKIADVRDKLHSTGHDQVEVQVDGNVSFANIPAMIDAGATMLVGGTSSIFHKDYTIPEAVLAVRQLMQRHQEAAS